MLRTELAKINNLEGLAGMRSGMPGLIIALLMFWWVISPKVGGGLSQYILYAIAGICAVLYWAKYGSGRIPIGKSSAQILIQVLLALSFLGALSSLVNFDSSSSKSIVHLFKPIFLAVYFLAAYVAAREGTEKGITRVLLLVAVGLFALQVLSAILQLSNPRILSFIYNASKTRGLGSLVRVTGTMVNPNAFAFCVTILVTLIIFMGRSSLAVVCSFLGGALLLLSGSRTGLVFFSIAIATAFIIRNKLSIMRLIYSVIVSVGSFALVLVVLNAVKAYLPYAKQILKIFLAKGGFHSINSLSVRFDIWDGQFGMLFGGNNVVHSVLGFWHGGAMRTSDNDLFYALFHGGIIGIFLHAIFYIVLFAISLRYKNYVLGRYLFCYMIIVTVFGLTAETLAGWFIPLVAVTIVGVLVALEKNQAYQSQV